MVASLSITKGKVITSGLAGILGALVFLTTIHIAAKIAVIALAAIATYLALSMIQKTNDNDVAKVAADTTKDDTDVGYGTGDEEIEETTQENTVISAAKQEKTNDELEAEAMKERAVKEMKDGLSGHMDINGNALPDNINTNTENHVSVDYREAMVVPENIVLGNNIPTQNNSSSTSIVMQSLPLHMDALGNSLSTEQPSTNISMKTESKKLSLAEELLLKCKQDNNKAFTK